MSEQDAPLPFARPLAPHDLALCFVVMRCRAKMVEQSYLALLGLPGD